MKLLVDWIKENPEYEYLLEEWDVERNMEELGLEVGDVCYASDKKVWWKCPICGESFQQIIDNKRKRNSKCPKCRKLDKWMERNPDYGSLLLQAWDREENKKEFGIGIGDVNLGSKKKIWWICRECGKKFQRTPSNMLRKTRTEKIKMIGLCRDCGVKYRTQERDANNIKKNGSLKDWIKENPDYKYLLEEWNTERNKKELGLSITDVTKGSEKKVYWICDMGHEYIMSLNIKIGDKRNCPVCYRGYQSSFPEHVIYYYLKQNFFDVINSYKPDWLKPSEIDIYIPELNLGIEYDGEYWHQDGKRDIRKNNLLREHNIRLIRIREGNCPILLNKNCYYIYTGKPVTNYTHLNKPLMELVEYIKTRYNVDLKETDIDILKDELENRKLFVPYEKIRTLDFVNPDLAKEWNFSKNGDLTPKSVYPNSGIKVWWKCRKCGNEYQATVNHRNNETGCRKCYEQRQRDMFALQWKEKYNIIRDYYIEYGNLLVASKTVRNTKDNKPFNLYEWLRSQRKKYKEGKLSQEQIDLLNEIGMVWDTNKDRKKSEKTVNDNSKQSENSLKSETEKSHVKEIPKIKYLHK